MVTPPESDYAPTQLPPTGAHVLAFVAILIGGICGGLIGYAFVELSCTGDCTLLAGGAGLLGAVIGAVGVGIVSVLALRAMGEWTARQEPGE